MAVQRIARDVKGDIKRQFDWQVLFLLWHNAAIVAVHNRDWAAPIALTGQPPIAQAIFGYALADAFCFAEIDGCCDGLVAGLPLFACETAVVEHLFGFHWHVGFSYFWVCVFRWYEGRDDWQFVFRCEFEITHVVSGTAKDSARSVIHQDKVRNVDRQVVICVEWVAHSDTSVETHLFSGFNFGSRCATFATFSAECGKLCVISLKCLGQRVIRRDAHKRRAV